MNMTNFYKQFAVFLAMMGTLFAVWNIDANFYQTVMMGIGGWQVGTWCSSWARDRWPTRG